MDPNTNQRPPDPYAVTPAHLRPFAGGAPGAFYMTGEDVLQISGWNITTSARLRASVRFLTIEGRIQAAEHDLTLTTDRVIASLVRQLGEGWLLNLTLRVVGATSPTGATFARAQIVRGLDASGIVLGTLAAGYVTSAQPIAYPGAGVRSMLDGPGNLRSITGTDPAAGVEVSETVPTGARWRVHSLYVTLVTDATVANRITELVLDDGASIVNRSPAATSQTASTTFQYSFSRGGLARSPSTSNTSQGGLPEGTLGAGSRIRTITSSLQAGDNYTAPQLLVEEWIDAP